MHELDDLQKGLYVWARQNALVPEDVQLAIYGQFMGVVEEVGELAHVLLKRSQGIRLDETTHAAERDAVGDIIIFLMNYCSVRDWQLSEILAEVSTNVLARDWRKNANNNP